MRDIAVTLAVFGSLPFILIHPWIGILVWTWLGFMNPHRLAWGFSVTMPFAMIVAITTLVAIYFSREPKRFSRQPEVILMLVFLAWMLVTTVMAYYPTLAWEQFDKVWKIFLMIFVATLVIYTKERLQALVWVIALSIGFFGVKGGIFTIMTGDAWKEYTFLVVPNQNAVGSFNIDIGAQAGTYYLDDLSLVDLSPEVGVETQAGPNVPDVPTLEQNYPNPFNPSTTLRYGLPWRSHVLLTVYNTLGQQIAVLQEGEQEAGYHEVVLDASGLASGVYLYRLQAGDFVEAKKLVLLR